MDRHRIDRKTSSNPTRQRDPTADRELGAELRPFMVPDLQRPRRRFDGGRGRLDLGVGGHYSGDAWITDIASQPDQSAESGVVA